MSHTRAGASMMSIIFLHNTNNHFDPLLNHTDRILIVSKTLGLMI